MSDALIRFTHFDAHDAPQGDPIEVNIEDLIEFLTTIEVSPVKEVSGFSPATFKGNYRRNTNVEAITMFVVDIDSNPPAFNVSEEELAAALGRHMEITWIAFNTYSHGLPDKGNRWRIAFPFDEPMPLSHFRVWSDLVWPKLLDHFGLTKYVDKATSDPARFFYDPRKPREESTHLAEVNRGKLFSWREVIGDVSKIEINKTPIVERAPEDSTKQVDLEDLRKRLDKKANGQKAQNLARGLPIVGAPEERAKGEDSRNEAWMKVTQTLAIVAHDWESTDGLLQICIPSLQKMQAKGDRTTIEDVRRMLEGARDLAPAIRAQNADEDAAKETIKRFFSSKAQTLNPEAPPLPEKIDDQEWKKTLTLNRNGNVAENEATVLHVLREHPLWKGKLRFNQVTKDIEFDCADNPHIPAKFSGSKVLLTDVYTTLIGAFFQTESFLLATIAEQRTQRAITVISRENAFNPVLEMARSVPWDGTERIETFLIDYFHAKLDENGTDLKRYMHEISRQFLLSAIARALRPGCKVDTTLVLEGPQGVGKSKGLQALFGPQYCHTSGVHPDGGTDSREPLSKNWAIILEEGAAFKKNPNAREAWKAFLTEQVDSFRYKYGYRTEKVPRPCIFVATTNEAEYLNDPTGNRRMLPCPLNNAPISTIAIESSAQQVWAEALVRVEAGEKWYTEDPELQHILNTVQQSRTSADPTEEAILSWIAATPTNQRPKEVTIPKVIDAIREKVDRVYPQLIGGTLLRMGCVKYQPHGCPRSYKLPKNLLELPYSADGIIRIAPFKVIK